MIPFCVINLFIQSYPRALSHTDRALWNGPSWQKRIDEWTVTLDQRFDCSTADALDFCVSDEDAEWLRRVRANLPASMGGRDVLFEKACKRKAEEVERKERARAKYEEEKKVRDVI